MQYRNTLMDMVRSSSEAVDQMQPMYEETLSSDFQKPLETVIFLLSAPLVSLLIDNIVGIFL